MDFFRKLRELLRHCELIIEVLDARDVNGTRLRQVEYWSSRARLVKVANKADLADRDEVNRLKSEDYVVLNSKAPNLNPQRKKLIQAMLDKTTIRPLRVVVVGYPNVGKSTIINMLAKKKVARASPVAGTTINIQWIRISPDILLMDSPGVFPYGEERGSLMRKGAVNISSIKNPEAHAYRIAKLCVGDETLRKWLASHFDISIDQTDAPETILEKIAERRKWLLKKGVLNLLEASKALLRAYQKAPKLR